MRHPPASLGPSLPLTAFATLALVVFAGCSATERTLFTGVGDRGVAGPTDPIRDAGSPTPDTAAVDAARAEGLPVETLDPNASFEWTETSPGAGTCPAGTYTGSFRCTIAGLVPIPLQGAITLTLGTTGERRTLEIVDGNVVGVDTNGADLLTANLVGSLDCDASEFSATTENGHALPNILLLPLQAFDKFDAALAGNFDATNLTITGTWTMTNQVGGVCQGTFRVSYSP